MTRKIVVNGQLGIIKASKYWRPFLKLFDKLSEISQKDNLELQKVIKWRAVVCRVHGNEEI